MLGTLVKADKTCILATTTQLNQLKLISISFSFRQSSSRIYLSKMQRSRLTTTPAPAAPTPAPQQTQPVIDMEETEKECSDEEDFELLIGFDPENAKNRLYNMSNSIRLSIKSVQI